MVVRVPQHTWAFNVDLLERWLHENGDGSRELLAGACNISSAAIEKIRERGHMPNGANLFALAEAMGITVDRLAIKVPKKKSA
jgi:transcriptional regulator with XRE-family HTH domain